MLARAFSALALSAALFATPVPAQQAAAEGILWARTWDAALAEAQARNCPILFTAHKDG